LWVRPRVARDALPAELAAVGAVVDEVVVYETRVASGASRAAQAVQDGAIDVVLFTSGSMVEILVDALGSDARSALSGVVVASIGAVTTAAAEKLGIRVDVKGTSRGVDGLLDALEEHLASGALPVSDKE
jgi:uroporphyrinogen III methyltransferase/synthase